MAAQVIPFNPTLDKVVLVNTVADLPEPILVGSDYIITLEQGVVYQFAPGVIDLGNNQIVCSLANKLVGQGSENTVLTSSLASGTWLKSLGPNGVCVIQGLSITLSDPAITAFEFSSLNQLIFTDVLTIVEGALGSMVDIQTMRCSNLCAFVNFTSGWQISGANGSFLFDRCGLININSTPATECVNVAAGTSFQTLFQFAGCVIVNASPNIAIVVDNSTTFTSGEQAYKIMACDFRGGGKAIGGIVQTSSYLLVKASYGIANTIGGQEYYFYDTPVATVINTSAVPEKIAGTTAVYNLFRDFDHPSDNTATYIGTSLMKARISATVFVEGLASNYTATLYIAKNGVVNPNMKLTAVIPPTGMVLTTQAIEDVKFNDYFELYIANETNDDDITVSSGNVHIIELG